MARPSTSARKRGLAALLAAATTVSGAALLAPGTSSASSHREAPYIQGDPAVDNTDTYAFVSPDDPNSVTMIGSWWPLEEPAGGPNFYPWDTQAAYDFNIDNDGDAKADITYRWTFKDVDKRGEGAERRPARHVPLRQRPGDVEHRREPAVPPDLRPDGVQQGCRDRHRRAARRARRAVERRCRDDPGLREAAPRGRHQRDHPAGPGSELRRPDRRRVLPRPAHLRPPLRRRPVREGLRHPLRLQRQLDRLQGAQGGHHGATTTPARTRSSASGRPRAARRPASSPTPAPASTRPRTTTRPAGTPPTSPASTSRSRAWATRWSTRPSSRPSSRTTSTGPRRPRTRALLGEVQDPEVPRLIEGVYEIPNPNKLPNPAAAKRNDLVATFLTGFSKRSFSGKTFGGLAKGNGVNADLNCLDLNAVSPDPAPAEYLRLNTAVPPTPANDPKFSRLGAVAGDLAGFPNGRRLTDDITDVTLLAAEGFLLGQDKAILDAIGTLDGVNSNDRPFLNTFPYIADPHTGSDVVTVRRRSSSSSASAAATVA